MGASTSFVTVAIWTGTIALVLTLLLALQIVQLRVALRRRERLAAGAVAKWRPLLNQAIVGEEPALPQLAVRERLPFLHLWAHLQGCLISLVDANRQWFKARVGLDACETPRDVSFCAHALGGESLLLIEDTLQDPRFRDNPLVTGAPHIRFYAGAPLIMRDGLAIGTLCLIDTRPRTLDAVAVAILRSLRDLAVLELGAQGVEAGDA